MNRSRGRYTSTVDPAPDRLGHLERPHELALLQSDDRRDESRQRGRLELQDEVARQVLEHVARRSSGVGVQASRRQIERVGDVGTDTRDVEDADAVGVRRQQAHEPGLHGAPLDGHHRLTIAPEDRRDVVGAGDRDVPARLHQARRVHRIVLAGQAELAAGDEREGAVGPDVVVGRPEEHELTPRQPREDRRHRRQRLHPVAHRGEVVDDPLHVGHGARDLGLDGRGGGVVRAVDLDLGPRLQPAGDVGRVGSDVDEAFSLVAHGPQHRVHEQVHAEAAPLEHEPHRVDEERHVVGDDQHDGVRRVPAVAFAVRRQDPRHARPWLARAARARGGRRRRRRCRRACGRRRRRPAARSSRAAGTARAADRRVDGARRCRTTVRAPRPPRGLRSARRLRARLRCRPSSPDLPSRPRCRAVHVAVRSVPGRSAAAGQGGGRLVTMRSSRRRRR